MVQWQLECSWAIGYILLRELQSVDHELYVWSVYICSGVDRMG